MDPMANDPSWSTPISDFAACAPNNFFWDWSVSNKSDLWKITEKTKTVPPCFRVSQPQPRRICFPRHDEVPAHWILSPILRQTKKVGYLVNNIYIPIESPKTSWLIFKKNIKRSQIWMEIEFVRDDSPWIYPSFRSPSLCNQKKHARAVPCSARQWRPVKPQRYYEV